MMLEFERGLQNNGERTQDYFVIIHLFMSTEGQPFCLAMLKDETVQETLTDIKAKSENTIGSCKRY